VGLRIQWRVQQREVGSTVQGNIVPGSTAAKSPEELGGVKLGVNPVAAEWLEKVAEAVQAAELAGKPQVGP
jgi:hypothetical protein